MALQGGPERQPQLAAGDSPESLLVGHGGSCRGKDPGVVLSLGCAGGNGVQGDWGSAS